LALSEKNLLKYIDGGKKKSLTTSFPFVEPIKTVKKE